MGEIKLCVAGENGRCGRRAGGQYSFLSVCLGEVGMLTFLCELSGEMELRDGEMEREGVREKERGVR